ncbi:Integration host factor subunit alpha [Aureliella helgolandensis]|uniref:Integration host factor subunit alpha n=1 Tax=Aureliella helgolandensis TaxID=2527968 RepID=A0A518G5Y8_9BACT|nr:Integration host factor subunit alpha [Aureliella helgolandensis]
MTYGVCGLAKERPHVTKKEIVKTISDKTGLTQLQIKEIVQLTFDGIVENLLDEGRVELRNFGVFQVKSRKARKARNPRTGRQVDVPEKFVVTFKPGKEMEARVQKLEDAAAEKARIELALAEQKELARGQSTGGGTLPGDASQPIHHEPN